MVARLRRSRIALSVQDQISAVSQVVREGGLDDEEEDFDNETGCLQADQSADEDAEAVGGQQESNEQEEEEE